MTYINSPSERTRSELRIRRAAATGAPNKTPSPAGTQARPLLSLPRLVESKVVPPKLQTSEDKEDERQLQQALTESLLDRNTTLEQTNRDNLNRLNVAEAQIERLENTQGQLRDENNRLRNVYSTVAALREEKTALEEQLRAYQATLAAWEDAQARLRQRLDLLDLSRIPDPGYSPDVAPKDNGNREARIDILARGLEAERRHTNLLHTHIVSLERSHEEEISRIRSQTFGGVPTARRLLVDRLISDRFEASITMPDDISSGGSMALASLRRHEIDTRLTQVQVHGFQDQIHSASLSIHTCELCKLPRLASSSPSTLMSEFPDRGIDPCCKSFVCKGCYIEHIRKSLARDWWARDLQTDGWIVCPGPDCGLCLPIETVSELQSVLLHLDVREDSCQEYIETFDVILDLRRLVSQLWHPSKRTNEELRITSVLHNQLTSAGVFHSFPYPIPNETRRDIFTGPESARMIDVEYHGHQTRIPLVTALFKQQTAPKECAYCAQEYSEVAITSPQDWMAVCDGFQGPWMWEILKFPLKLGLTCTHPINFCTSCFDRHVKARLEDDGRSKCDEMACPEPGCRRLLTYDEIRLYAQQATFATYDHYLTLNALSKLPTFRWCLRPGCQNGQLYEVEQQQQQPATGGSNGPEGGGGRVPVGGPVIECGVCTFSMCYTHSVPWHSGQTCAQYSSDQGDPQSQLSKVWIDANTKKCPKCKVSINKGENCFHMTCTCRFQFCWECLVDWKLICPSGGTYNQNAHAERCFFRTSSRHLRPTGVIGETLDGALGRNGNNNAGWAARVPGVAQN